MIYVTGIIMDAATMVSLLPRVILPGADYMVSGTLLVKPYTQEVTNHPLEIKWVPTAGKFTLKENDLKSYVRERASILFIYNTGSAKLKKPSDYNLEKHIN